MIHLNHHHHHPAHEEWRLLRVYIYYRVVLALLLVTLYTIRPAAPLLGANDPRLYLFTCVNYLFVTLIGLVLSRRHPTNPRFHGFITAIIDITAITVILHANGGPTPQLSMLYLVVVAASNILLTGTQGALIAAVAAIAVLYEQFFFVITNSIELNSQTFGQAALLGLSFFTVSLFSQLVSDRFRQMEALARQRSLEIANLQQLNEQIIERMHTGIIVVNQERQVVLLNHASRQLLGINTSFAGMNLKELSPILDAGILAWRQSLMQHPLTFKNQPGYPELNVSYMNLSHTIDNPFTLIFLENTAQMTQKAQQLKLASLGRLTASIAHEIRNPLGAISHAGQLLAESEVLVGPDRRLINIIQQHCVRVNGIIESVLQLSRREKSLPELMDLNDWLSIFLEDMSHIHPDITLNKVCDNQLMVRFDAQQLYQITSNLVSNGIHHGLKNHSDTIDIRAGLDPISKLPYLDIRDYGFGITPEQQKNLFEPFFTTEKNGTGLGLYISRELCQANQAHLDYIPQDIGACFRISFSHPNRLI